MMLDAQFVDYVYDTLTQIEASIADSILDHYYKLREKLKKSRTRYLRGRIQEEKNKSLSVNYSREIGTNTKIEHGRTNQRIYTKKIEKSLEKKEKNVVFKQYLRPRGVSVDFLERNYRGVELCEKPLHKNITKKQFIHLNHPPSKVINDPYKGFNQENVDHEYIKQRSKPEQAYRLFNKDSREISDRSSFHKFYSGGPVSRQQQFSVRS